MTLYDRDAFTFYMEGVQRNSNYQVIPVDVSEFAYELESIYTYRHDVGTAPWYFVIGKVKGT